MLSCPTIAANFSISSPSSRDACMSMSGSGTAGVRANSWRPSAAAIQAHTSGSRGPNSKPVWAVPHPFQRSLRRSYILSS
jgi:hypothetical protein